MSASRRIFIVIATALFLAAAFGVSFDHVYLARLGLAFFAASFLV